MIKTILLMFALSSVARAQFGFGKTGDGMEYMSTRLGFPCDPAIDVGMPCMPEQEGVLVQVSSPKPIGPRYRITVKFINLDGEEESRSITFPWEKGWNSRAFRIGRVKTPTLTGVTVTEVRIEREGGKVVILTEKE